LGQALEESAIERLGVDQRPLPAGPLRDTRAEIERSSEGAALRARLRLLEQDRLATMKVRQRAERALADAEKKLDRSSLLARGRRHTAQVHALEAAVRFGPSTRPRQCSQESAQ